MLRRSLVVLSALAAAAGPARAEPPVFTVAMGRAAVAAGDYAAAESILTPLAARRDPEARLALGALHLEERLPRSDPAEGRLMILLAATAGLPAAQARYGEMLRTGEHTLRDPKMAAEWCAEAALAGDAQGALCLGRLRRDGAGKPRDAAEAVRWFAVAAEAGAPEAHVALGEMLAAGVGAPRNLRAAREHFLLAAGRGDAQAQFRLGEMARDGRAAPADPADARRWFEKAAISGHQAARRALALGLAETGRALKDVTRAYAWANLAAAAGDPEMAALRDRLGARLDHEGLAEAEALSTRFARGEFGAPSAPADPSRPVYALVSAGWGG